MSDQPIELIARGVFVHQDQLLLCQSKLGHTFLPGGHVDFGERAGDALVREIREELGIDLRLAGFLGACEACFDQTSKSGKARRHHEVNLVFRLESPLGHAFDPATVVSREKHIDFYWVPVSTVSTKPILPRGIAGLITAREPEWITVFD